MEIFRQIESRWRHKWETAKIFEADPDQSREKRFITFPYSYTDGPLHVGHGFTATRVDAYARFKRMQGYNVMFPWAWHWTGQPITGASERVRQGDKAFIRSLKEIDGVSTEHLKKFVDPIYFASYYTEKNRETVHRIGFSIDWRREFHTTAPTFSKFIEWQYHRLRQMGYVAKGTHPVVWCPHCESPTGDHDRQEGEGVSPEEYTLIKFRFGEAFLPAATFRPETIYGVTNMWIHPDAIYVKARVNNEEWIISEEAAEKLKEQQRKVEITARFKGRSIIGQAFVNPINNAELPILPGWFVSPAHATGVVYSVPAHAPYDWLALRDLQEKPGLLSEFNIKPSMVKAIQSISMISVENFGEYPAIEIVDQMGIIDQHDPKAEEATKQLYKKEFHSGILKDICEGYAGRTVAEVKDQLIEDFKQSGIADSMYDLPNPVICRCLTPCIIKVLEDQWFLRYSDKAWKEKARAALDQASIYPETSTQWFINIIEWLREWACARKTGLGTPLPWSPGWIVETLSDSTVYMAFYTINKHIKHHALQPKQLTTQVFDYIFYGENEVEQVAQASGISLEVLKSMRAEFLYFYPVDLRVSAKELVPNHLTFFLFHHAVLFPKQLPRAIGVNGMLMIEGRKMSKSKGNFVTLNSALDLYGADVTRCALLLGAEDMDDPDWRSENVRDVKSKLESFYNLALKIIGTNTKSGEDGHLEKWLASRLEHRIGKVTESMEVLKTRTAIENVLFEVWNDFRWYRRRTEQVNHAAQKKALEIWLRLLAPFAPYICEELWERLGGHGFISLTKWPTTDKAKIDILAEETEGLVKNVLDDTSNILRATKIQPKIIYYYSAASWKWDVYLKLLKESLSGELNQDKAMKELMIDPRMKQMAKAAATFIRQTLEEIGQIPIDMRQRRLSAGMIDEAKAMNEARSFLERELGADVSAYREEELGYPDPKKRARFAKPYRPAIYIE